MLLRPARTPPGAPRLLALLTALSLSLSLSLLSRPLSFVLSSRNSLGTRAIVTQHWWPPCLVSPQRPRRPPRRPLPRGRTRGRRPPPLAPAPQSLSAGALCLYRPGLFVLPGACVNQPLPPPPPRPLDTTQSHRADASNHNHHHSSNYSSSHHSSSMPPTMWFSFPPSLPIAFASPPLH